MSRQDDVKKLIANYQRRLQKLQEQKALLGLNTPPHVLMEIEDIELELAALQIELAAASEAQEDDEAPAPGATSSR